MTFAQNYIRLLTRRDNFIAFMWTMAIMLVMGIGIFIWFPTKILVVFFQASILWIPGLFALPALFHALANVDPDTKNLRDDYLGQASWLVFWANLVCASLYGVAVLSYFGGPIQIQPLYALMGTAIGGGWSLWMRLKLRKSQQAESAS